MLSTYSPFESQCIHHTILQSGTAYMMFGQSDNMRYKWEQSIRESTNCDAKLSTHECLDNKTAEEIVTQTKILNFFVPVADDDFFADEVVLKESYDVSKRQVCNKAFFIHFVIKSFNI